MRQGQPFFANEIQISSVASETRPAQSFATAKAHCANAKNRNPETSFPPAFFCGLLHLNVEYLNSFRNESQIQGASPDGLSQVVAERIYLTRLLISAAAVNAILDAATVLEGWRETNIFANLDKIDPQGGKALRVRNCVR